MAELDPETRERLQALCSQITVAHELDPEIQEELYGHMEDKLLAYFSGQERLTEQDAFVLVREHFGDAGALIQRLRQTHAADVHLGFARRAVMAFVASSSAFLIANALLLFYALAFVGTSGYATPFTVIGTRAFPYVYALSVPLSAAIAVLILARWRRAMRAGARPWFARHLVLAAAAVVVALKVFPFQLDGLIINSFHTLGSYSPLANAYKWFYTVVAPLALTGHVIVWMWWCEPAPRTVRGIARTAIAWALATLVWVAVPHVLFLFTHNPGHLGTAGIVGLDRYMLAHGSQAPFRFHGNMLFSGHSPWSSLILSSYYLLLLWGAAACAGIWTAGQLWVSRQRKARGRRYV